MLQGLEGESKARAYELYFERMNELFYGTRTPWQPFAWIEQMVMAHQPVLFGIVRIHLVSVECGRSKSWWIGPLWMSTKSFLHQHPK